MVTKYSSSAACLFFSFLLCGPREATGGRGGEGVGGWGGGGGGGGGGEVGRDCIGQ